MSTATDEARAKAARDAIFSQHAEMENRCAQYTANMAYYFMNGQMKPTFAGNGDMGTQAYYNTIQSFGYNLTINQTSISKDTLKSSIYNSTFPPGSVVCYKGEEGNPEKSYYMYGHTQFYVGGDRRLGTSFPSSKKANYGGAFVYNEKPCDKWTYKVFTPSGSTTSNFYYCEQEYVPTISSPSLPSPPADNNGKPGSGLEFYKPFNVGLTNEERNNNGRYIIQRLQTDSGLNFNEACAFAGTFGGESEWNPTAYSKNTSDNDFGIAQWTTPYGRQQYFYEVLCNSNKTNFRDIQHQMDFVKFELHNVYISRVTGGRFDYTDVISALHKLSSKGATLQELIWCVVSYYEAGSTKEGVKWKTIPYSQEHWDKNHLHIQRRYEWAQRALTLF